MSSASRSRSAVSAWTRPNASAHLLAFRLESGERIEQVEVRRGIEEHLVLVLAVKIDELGGGIPERGGGDEGSVHEGAAPAALRRDVPPDHQLSAGQDPRKPPRLPPDPRPSAPAPPRPARQPAGRPPRPGWISRRQSRPVSTFRPGSNSSSSRSMTARLRMERKRSIGPEVPSYQMFDSVYGACYACRHCAVPAARSVRVEIPRRSRLGRLRASGCTRPPASATVVVKGAPRARPAGAERGTGPPRATA